MKKRFISAFIALFLILSLSAPAFAAQVRVFEEDHSTTADDTAFREIYREATVVYISESYTSQWSYIADPQKTCAELGVEPLKPSYYPNYTVDEQLDLYEGCLERMKELNCENLSLENRFLYDYLEEFLETELMRRSFGDIFESYYPYMGSFGNGFPRVIDSEETLSEALDVMSGFYEFTKFACAHEMERLEKGLRLTDEQIDGLLYNLNMDLDNYYNDPDYLILSEYDIFMELMEGFSEETRSALNERYRELVLTVLIPADELLRDTMEKERDSGIEPHGLAYYEGGLDYLRYLLRNATGINIEDFEAFIEEWDEVCQREGAAYMDFFESPDYAGQMAEPYDYDFENMTDEEMFALWVELVKNDYPEPVTTECSFEHLNDDTEAFVAQYRSPRYGGTNNSIEINDHKYLFENNDAAYAATTIAHECIPGHMYHYDMLMEKRDPLRWIAASFGHLDRAFVEGWAYSAESKLYDYIGANETQKRNARDSMKYYSLGDYMVHGLRFHTRGDTISEYLDFRGITPDMEEYEGDAVVVYSSFARPFNLPASFFGYVWFDDAHDRAVEELGEYFDEKEYNQFLMDLGVCGLETLEKWEGIWIDKVKAERAGKDSPDTGAESADAFIALALTAGAVMIISKRGRAR